MIDLKFNRGGKNHTRISQAMTLGWYLRNLFLSRLSYDLLWEQHIKAALTSKLRTTYGFQLLLTSSSYNYRFTLPAAHLSCLFKLHPSTSCLLILGRGKKIARKTCKLNIAVHSEAMSKGKKANEGIKTLKIQYKLNGYLHMHTLIWLTLIKLSALRKFPVRVLPWSNSP